MTGCKDGFLESPSIVSAVGAFCLGLSIRNSGLSRSSSNGLGSVREAVENSTDNFAKNAHFVRGPLSVSAGIFRRQLLYPLSYEGVDAHDKDIGPAGPASTRVCAER